MTYEALKFDLQRMLGKMLRTRSSGSDSDDRIVFKDGVSSYGVSAHQSLSSLRRRQFSFRSGQGLVFASAGTLVALI